MKQKVLGREMRTKVGEVVRGTKFRGEERNYTSCFEGSQSVPARPSGRVNAYDRN
jgi:hypothetical protein